MERGTACFLADLLLLPVRQRVVSSNRDGTDRDEVLRCQLDGIVTVLKAVIVYK